MNGIVLSTQAITPLCRENRTVDGAWEEAVRRLREVYDVQLRRFEEEGRPVTLTLGIARSFETDLPSGLTTPEPFSIDIAPGRTLYVTENIIKAVLQRASSRTEESP